jgi:hypothetical protein
MHATLGRMTHRLNADKLHETASWEKTVSQPSELKESGIPFLRVTKYLFFRHHITHTTNLNR